MDAASTTNTSPTRVPENPGMTEELYQQLTQQWDELDVRRQELSSQHDPHGETFFEDESWHKEFETIEKNQELLLQQINAYEEAEMSKLREFKPPVVDGQVRAAGDFAWDDWEQWAKEDGISENLASLGRAVIREAYQHNWPEPLKEECGWSDDGAAMIQLAVGQPDRARIRWQYLLDSDGDFHWAD